MRNNLHQTFRFFSVRIALGLLLTTAGISLAVIGLAPQTPSRNAGPVLRINKLSLHPATAAMLAGNLATPATLTVLPPNTPTFGQPVISGIGGLGFEEAIRIDPSNPDRVYTSAPGTASADTSWIWHSLDGGKTFKWVVGATPLEGKVTTCHGGGDTEILVDGIGRVYFNALTLADFS